jgi:cell division protease FtsH
MGPERKSRVVTDETRRMVAYHEAGHAIVAFNLEHADPVHKVTIVPRGRAGGVTFTLPEDDRDEVSREWCLDSVTMAMGGRVAERMVLNRLGSGAMSDILQATKMVRRMVTRWGMSDKLGPVAYGETEEQVFLGKEWGHKRDFSEATAQKIDDEVTRIINECFGRAEKILTEHMDQLHLLAKTLLDRETVDGEELRKLLAGEPLPPVRSIGTTPASSNKTEAAPTTPDGDATKPAGADAPAASSPATPERPNTAAASSTEAPNKAPRPASS